MRLYMGLVHYPVYNKNDETIASALTTLDLHDLSRLARTYGVRRFFVITPLDDQQDLARRILGHWTSGYGAKYNRHRKEALELAVVVSSLEESLGKVFEREGERPLLIATDAGKQKQSGKVLGYEDAVEILNSPKPVMLLFGTAWGLEKGFMEEMDYILEPVEGATEYNHLSVRTAAAVILDRLAGRR